MKPAQYRHLLFWIGFLFFLSALTIIINHFSKEFPTSLSGHPSPAARLLQSIPTPSRVTGCRAKGALPDSSCTPGALNPAVTPATLQITICKTGYAASVRPPVKITDPIKEERMAAYGYAGRNRKEFELDHLIPLELGGAPSSLANLWPEAASPAPGYHEKDRVEDYLHQEVCAGRIPLQEAQQEIASNWLSVYDQIR